MQPIISLIIPVYNTGKYLEGCLRSVLNQTDQDFEVIVINDGSTDDSLAVAKRLLAGRPLTRIVTQHNSGVSAARNHGVDIETGIYVTFLDSDDIIKDDYIQTLKKSVKDEAYDYVMSGITFVANGKAFDSVDYEDEVLTINDIRESKFYYVSGATRPVGFLYKIQIIRDNLIYFNSRMSYAEDRNFNIDYLAHVYTIRRIPYNGYTYLTEVEGSLSKKKYSYAFQNDIIYWKKTKDLLLLPNGNEQLKSYLAERLFHFVIDNIVSDLSDNSYKGSLKRLNEVLPIIDLDFIRANQGFMNTPKWQLKLLLNSPQLLLTVLYLKNIIG